MTRETWNSCKEQLKNAFSKLLIQGEDENSDRYYLPQGKARNVFYDHSETLRKLYILTYSSQKRQESELDSFLTTIIGSSNDDALSNILATLLYGPISAESVSWNRFLHLCELPIDRRPPTFCDGHLPLTQQNVTRILGENNSDKINFLRDQHIFAPLILSRGEMLEEESYQRLGHLPWIRKHPVKKGSHGSVYEGMLAGSQFGLATNGTTICACKDYDLTQKPIFRAEWEYHKLLSYSKARFVGGEYILEIFAAVETPQSLSLFCELAQCDLEDLMKGEKPSGSPGHIVRRLDRFSGLFSGIEFLHSAVECANGTRASCFHLDLTPRNILVFNRGLPNEVFKISDFSISRSKHRDDYIDMLADPQKSLRDMSTTARLGDTNICLAPEAYFEGRVNASNDIWHLGCVLSIFMTWLVHGSSGVEAFMVARSCEPRSAGHFFWTPQYSDFHPNDIPEKVWCKWRPVEKKYSYFMRTPEVEEWIEQLVEDTPGSTEKIAYSQLVQLLKDDMLVVDPEKRKRIERVRQSLLRIVGTAIELQLDSSLDGLEV